MTDIVISRRKYCHQHREEKDIQNSRWNDTHRSQGAPTMLDNQQKWGKGFLPYTYPRQHGSANKPDFRLYLFIYLFIYYPELTSDHNFVAYAFYVAGITNTCHHTQLVVWNGGLTNFLLGLALNCDLPNLLLSSSWDYKHEPQFSAWFQTFMLQNCKNTHFFGLRPTNMWTIYYNSPQKLTHVHYRYPVGFFKILVLFHSPQILANSFFKL
jgi:hypothetical protein